MKRDFVYNEAIPTFHHWKTGNTKFGLTFVSASEAKAFDHSVTTAINDLLLSHGESFMLQSSLLQSSLLQSTTTACKLFCFFVVNVTIFGLFVFSVINMLSFISAARLDLL